MVPTLILLLSCAAMATEPSPSAEAAEERPAAAVPAVDEERVRAAGIRKLVGQHLTLHTDLPAGADVDGLTADFDRAYTQWCEYFGLSPRRGPPWRVTACVIEDKQKFVRVGLMPKDLPPFLHAYFRGNRLWVYEQPSAYYRRHLLLHEGTHAFMNAHLGSCGPPWYKEGMAELLATHAIEDGHVSLNHFPADPEEVPDWGRIRLVRDALAAGRRLTMDEVLGYGSQAHVEVEPYGWCWAAAAFLDGHPRYRERFRQLPAHVKAADFDREVRKLFAADWPQLAEEWQLFVERLDFGYDFQREAIDFRPGKPLARTGATVEVAADSGWQSSGVEPRGWQHVPAASVGTLSSRQPAAPLVERAGRRDDSLLAGPALAVRCSRRSMRNRSTRSPQARLPRPCSLGRRARSARARAARCTCESTTRRRIWPTMPVACKCG